MQLMYQCKFLASEWDHIFGTVHMLPGVGAAGLCLLMDSSIVSAYVIAFEYDRLLHSFRTAHISIRGSPAFQPLPPPPGMLQTNSSEGFEEKYKFGVVDFKRDVKECCRVWNEAVSVFKERFEEWLNISPEKASDGLKACLARAVYVGAEMKRIAGPDGTKRKWAGYDDRKEEAEELRKKLDCVGAEFLRIIGGNPEGADPF
jgi:hypothetical protein